MPSASDNLWQAYSRQVQPRLDREVLVREQAQQDFQNQRVMAGDALQQEQAQRQKLQFDQTQQDRQSAMRDQSLNRVNAIAAKALQLQGPQRKQFLAQQIQNYAPDFEAAGFDMAQVPSLMQQDDADLENDLRARAWMAQEPDAGPKIGGVQPGDFTPESLAAFTKSNNYADLKRYVPPQAQGGQNAPSGYRFTPQGSLAAIPGGPADPNTKSTKDDSRTFAKADKLRDEFNSQSKDFVSVNDAYNVVKETAANPSAAGDLSLIFAYMKMLDPTSVVREQEFANAQNAAGIPDRVRNAYNKALKGERLNPDQRKDFINQAKNLYGTRKARNDQLKGRYSEIAKRNGVNPDDVVGDLDVIVGGPTVGTVQDGYRFKGGDPANQASWEKER